MKTAHSVKAVLMATIAIFIGGTLTSNVVLAYNGEVQAYVSNNVIDSNETLNLKKNNKVKQNPTSLAIDLDPKIIKEVYKKKKIEEKKEAEEKAKTEIVYDGLTLNELSAKLNKSLNSTLSGYGKTFASYSVKLGLDPYLAVAIVLHETGCKWSCSTLLKQCNNVGGMKGSNSCNGGSYASFDSLETGIKAYLDNLYYNYYKIGLTTPELINPKYAESTTWADNVKAYIKTIKAK